MDPKTLADILNRLSEVESSINNLNQVTNGLKLDASKYLDANSTIPPGIACKVAYDSKGLILNSFKLLASDIPDIQISQVIGLEKSLKSIINESDIKKIKSEMMELIPKKGGVIGTATKVNFDSNGYIISSADLSIDDIPDLPMSKIEGLPDIIKIIESMSSPSSNEDTYSITPGTYTKITYDANGRVVNGSKLTMDDIPIEIVNKVNLIESSMADLASQSTVNGLISSMNKKVDANDLITPGTFTKIKVDSKGLVTKGESLSKSDLPQIDIDDIPGLRNILKKTAMYTDIIELRDSVSTILSSIQHVGEIVGIKNDLRMKANEDVVLNLASEMKSMKSLMSTLQEKIPNELIMEQLQQITNDISTLAGRISVLEKKLNFTS